ncbi:hypothetical protein ACVC7V_16100 [Hydrogenophaga sp. A37]|uniref:hypothetical protein n=1 Tax=Hydrogenophaga sp. A37 TaxID=1945864 RepID=UPI0015C52C42|nr:hypothetical protein [Hydrogenophaga sp. A37]
MAFAAGYPCSYSFDGETGVLPEVSQLLVNRDGSHLLRIDLGGATANCHFFMASEIELDVDPREVQNADAHDAVLSFVEGMARAIGRPVLLTPENGSHVPYLSYEPTCGEWHAHS